MLTCVNGVSESCNYVNKAAPVTQQDPVPNSFRFNKVCLSTLIELVKLGMENIDLLFLVQNYRSLLWAHFIFS